LNELGISTQNRQRYVGLHCHNAYTLQTL